MGPSRSQPHFPHFKGGEAAQRPRWLVKGREASFFLLFPEGHLFVITACSLISSHASSYLSRYRVSGRLPLRACTVAGF